MRVAQSNRSTPQTEHEAQSPADTEGAVCAENRVALPAVVVAGLARVFPRNLTCAQKRLMQPGLPGGGVPLAATDLYRVLSDASAASIAAFGSLQAEQSHAATVLSSLAVNSR
jgi:hypothetical protein